MTQLTTFTFFPFTVLLTDTTAENNIILRAHKKKSVEATSHQSMEVNKTILSNGNFFSW